MITGSKTLIGVLALALCCAATPARAQPTDQSAAAETLFQQGMALLDAGKLAEACPKLAASHKLDPGFGVLFNLADCHEREGKTATAWAEFREAGGMAQRSGESEREQKSTRRATALEPRLVKLVVRVTQPTPGLVVTRDGIVIDAAMLGTPAPVDPGKHVVDATAPGYRAWRRDLTASAPGSTIEVAIPALEPRRGTATHGPEPASPTGNAVSPTVPPSGGLGTRRILALSAAGLGVVLIGVGSGVAVSAQSTYDDSGAYCDSKNVCAKPGLDLRDSAFGTAGVATGLFIAGGLALAGGAVLWLTAPSTETPRRATARLHLSPTPTGASASLRGGW